MDIVKLLLCVMLLLLYQSCWAERATKNDARNIKHSDDKKRASTRRTKIIEEDGTRTNSKELNLSDKTDININIKPKPPRVKPSNVLRKTTSTKNSLIPEKINYSNIRPLDQESTNESKVMKAIHIPIDLLLKDHNKENSTVETKSNIVKTTHHDVKEQPNIEEADSEISDSRDIIKDINPKIHDVEEKMESESRSAKIIEDNSVIKDDLDIRMGDDCVDKLLNFIPHSTENSYFQHPEAMPKTEMNKTEFTGEINQVNDTLTENEVDKEKISIHYSTNDNETLKEQIDSQATKIEIMINHLPSNATTRNPYSSIVIHNNTYQEVSEPVYHYPYYKYPVYQNYFTYSTSNQCKENPQYGAITCNNWPQYYAYPIQYNDKSNRVWKTWNCMDIRINPNEKYERYKRGAE